MKNVYNETVWMICCAVVAVMAVCSTLAATTWTDENDAVWTYSVSGNGVTIREYASPEGNVVIPQSIEGKPVVAIYSKAFQDCPWIRSVKIPDNVTNIGSYAFSGCAWLESVTFPSCEFKIGSKAFYNCTRLSDLKNMTTVKSISANAFNGCDSLGKGVIILGGWVLQINGACPSEVILPEGTVSIVGGAFMNCTNLRTVRIPKSLEVVDASAFNGCSGLVEFIVDSENPYFRSENGMLVSKADNRLVCGVNGDVEIPEGIVEIGSNAFSGFENLTSAVIPNSVTNIGDSAFRNCKALKHVEIPESIVAVGLNAFEGCDGLDNVDVWSLGAFSGNAKHVYAGVILKGDATVGIVQLATAKATKRGVRVSGSILLDDGKKYAIKLAQAPIENGVLKIATKVSKLGAMTLVIGLNGFKGNVGTNYLVRSADTSGTSVLKGSITKMYVDAGSGKFKTKRVTLTGFSLQDSESSGMRADGVIQEKGKDSLSFYASVE